MPLGMLPAAAYAWYRLPLPTGRFVGGLAFLAGLALLHFVCDAFHVPDTYQRDLMNTVLILLVAWSVRKSSSEPQKA